MRHLLTQVAFLRVLRHRRSHVLQILNTRQPEPVQIIHLNRRHRGVHYARYLAIIAIILQLLIIFGTVPFDYQLIQVFQFWIVINNIDIVTLLQLFLLVVGGEFVELLLSRLHGTSVERDLLVVPCIEVGVSIRGWIVYLLFLLIRRCLILLILGSKLIRFPQFQRLALRLIRIVFHFF